MADWQSAGAHQESKMALGPLVVLSGPSGAGKSTVLRRLVAESGLRLHVSVSATTRPPRQGEVDGKDYYFWSRERFDEEKKSGAFLEWAEVYGRAYGTLRREVEPYRRQGIGVILDIDVNGARQVRRLCPEVVSIFLRASCMEAYEERLRQRGTENEETIQRRLAGGLRELAHVAEYDHQVVNDDLDSAVARLRDIIGVLFQGRENAG